MPLFVHKARQNADEMIVAQNLGERKKLMLERCDAIITLAGGIGTLDEATEMLALKRHGVHNKAIVFLNTNGFYEGMKAQMNKMEEDGFLHNMENDVVPGSLAYFADTPEAAMQYIEAHGS